MQNACILRDRFGHRPDVPRSRLGSHVNKTGTLAVAALILVAWLAWARGACRQAR